MNPTDSHTPVALITGAGAGVGRAAADLFTEQGFSVVLVGRTESKLRETQRLCAERVNRQQDASTAPQTLVVAADVSKPDDARRMIDAAIERFGRLDALINNAGVAPLLPIEETTVDILRETFAVNALGPGYAIHFAWPVFVKQNHGCIVNVSTVGTQDPFPGFFAYAASKSAVNLYARSCANEGRKHNIRAFTIAPGAVETAMLRALFDEKTLPPEKCLSPQDVAKVIVACATGERDDENGETIWISN